MEKILDENGESIYISHVDIKNANQFPIELRNGLGEKFYEIAKNENNLNPKENFEVVKLFLEEQGSQSNVEILCAYFSRKRTKFNEIMETIFKKEMEFLKKSQKKDKKNDDLPKKEVKKNLNNDSKITNIDSIFGDSEIKSISKVEKKNNNVNDVDIPETKEIKRKTEIIKKEKMVENNIETPTKEKRKAEKISSNSIFSNILNQHNKKRKTADDILKSFL